MKRITRVREIIKVSKIVAIGVFLLQVMTASALEISVGKGKEVAKPIAVVPFAGNGGMNKIDFIVSSDLKQSGLFSPINPASYQQRPASPQQINYQDFQKRGAAYIVVGKQNANQSLSFSVADAVQKQVIANYTVSLQGLTLRQAAHKVSDLILFKLTGKRGAFATRLVYVHETGGGLSRRYNLMLSDSDGKNAIRLLSSRAPIMSPRFSPNGKAVAYVTFEGGNSQIVTHNIYTGKRSLVSKEVGINALPAWSPDGSKIAMVLSKDGNSEIYFKNIYNNTLVRVTNNAGIDSEPVWSPSGNEIYFTSDRSGSPQLYVINLSTGALRRITNGSGYSAGADISSDGKLLALARKEGSGFSVGTIKLSTGRFTPVSRGFSDETPRFSPNGKMVVFTSVKNNRSVLKIVNVDDKAGSARTLSVAGHIRDADWSSYIK